MIENCRNSWHIDKNLFHFLTLYRFSFVVHSTSIYRICVKSSLRQVSNKRSRTKELYSYFDDREIAIYLFLMTLQKLSIIGWICVRRHKSRTKTMYFLYYPRPKQKTNPRQFCFIFTNLLSITCFGSPSGVVFSPPSPSSRTKSLSQPMNNFVCYICTIGNK